MSSVYPSLGPEVLFNLPHYLFDKYLDEIPVVLTRQQTMMNLAAVFPNMDEEGRHSVSHIWMPEVVEDLTAPVEKMSQADYFSTLAEMGLSFEYNEVRLPIQDAPQLHED